MHHITWSINSICHFFGRRRFDTDDESTNVFWLALPSLGEAWHHNHHAFPQSAFHGLRWYELDPSGWLILAMARVGLAWDVVTVTPERARAKLAGVPTAGARRRRLTPPACRRPAMRGERRASGVDSRQRDKRRPAALPSMDEPGFATPRRWASPAPVKPRLRGVSHEYAFFVSLALRRRADPRGLRRAGAGGGERSTRSRSRRCSARARCITA